MKNTTLLRLTGALVILGMLWVIGTYNLNHPLVAVIVFGFAAGFEFLVVRPAGKNADAVTQVKRASHEPIEETSVPNLSGESKTAAKSKPSNDDARAEEDLWTVAITEFEGCQRVAGLWAKSFAMENGDEVKAKAMYLRERVQQLAVEAATRKRTAAIQHAMATQDLLEGITKATKGLIDGTGSTPAHVAFLARNSGFNASLINFTDRNRGDTLLHLCARYGFHDEALMLLRNGADPNVGNGNGQKPYALADFGTMLRNVLHTAAEETATK